MSRHKRLDDTKQFDRYTQRAEKVAEYAARLLARATTTEETGDALAQFDRAAAFAKQAEAIADRRLRGFADYLTLDTAAVLSAAVSDPEGFIAGLKGPTVIDEVQRVPRLALAIKADVDRRRRAGRFLLTGSASVMALPSLSESLAGRMELHTLWPFSHRES
ncbi:MAG: AAA family ATPase [Pirellulales bacterium]|nr:AAA family ATPase [Pirellulales bacterium]